MKQLVYVVTYEDWTEWEIIGVFLDKEKAVGMATDLNKRHNAAGSKGNHFNVQAWDVEKQTMEFLDLEE